MQTDGQTDMTKLMVAFHNFAKAPKDPRILWNPKVHSRIHNSPPLFPACASSVHIFPNDFFKIQSQRLKKTYENCYTV